MLLGSGEWLMQPDEVLCHGRCKISYKINTQCAVAESVMTSSETHFK